MKITLYDHAYETFAIQFLSSTLLKHGFDVEVYFDCSMNMDMDQSLFYVPIFSSSEDRIAEAILKTNPDIVGFSILTAFYPKMSNIIRKLKELKPALVIVGGGPHCNLLPDKVLENHDIDFICIGDADISFPVLLYHLKRHPIDQVKAMLKDALPGISNMLKGSAMHRGMGQAMLDLDPVPFPYKEPYYRKNPSLKSIYTTTASRGCFFTCTYCNSNNLRKLYQESGYKYFRVSSVGRLMKELEFAKKTYNPKHIMFLDNLFGPDKDWLREFVSEYKQKINIPFYCETNPTVHTTQTLDMLADAGCVLLQFGFQSTIEDVRRNTLHRYETNDSIRSLVKHAHTRKIFVLVDHIANLPGETREHLDEAIKFYKEIRPDWVNLAYLQYFPKSEIVDIAVKMGALNEAQAASILNGENLSAWRLLPKLQLSPYYRTLALRLFCAFKLPRLLGDMIIRLLDVKLFSTILSAAIPIFIYASRIGCAYTDKRDFLIRHHVLRNFYVMKVVFKEKYLKNG